MIARTQRIETLRRHSLEHPCKGFRSDEGQLFFYRSWLKNQYASSKILRRAIAKADMLAQSTLVIEDGALVVGRPCYRELEPAEREELDLYLRYTEPALDPHWGQDSHMAIDYEKLLHKGLHGIRAEVCTYRQALDLSEPANLEKEEFYHACLVALDALENYAGRYSRYAAQLAEQCGDPVRQAELLEISRILQRVPMEPAEHFTEAVQSIHFVNFCLEGLYQLGRPDRYLLPYYLADRDKGILTEEEAQQWIDCLCLMYDEYVPSGLAAGFMICGRDKDGRDMTNQLSYMFLDSIDHVRLSYPGIGVCWNPDTPEDILEKSCLLLSKGYSHPAIFNDDLIIRGLTEYGVPYEEACDYVHSTCVEITLCRSSTVWVASPYINLLDPVLELMGLTQDGQYRENPATFEGFIAAYERRLAQIIETQIQDQNRQQMERQKNGGDPFVSCFVNDCLALGKDQDWGGGRYKYIMPSFVGLANLIDSLVSLQKLVYEERRFTLERFGEILKTNYQGQEPLRQEILNRLPKYGNDDDSADYLAQRLTSFICSETVRHKTWFGQQCIPSLFCWIMHDRLGRATGATPDGRWAGFPLGDGSGPAQGREKKGPTASILSSTKWDQHKFIGGVAVNLKFGKSMFTPDALPKMQQVVKTFLERGGFEVQINVVNRETLLAAQKNPEAYQDLVVRIGGYSDYFVRLSPTMQQEVLLRTAHEL